MKVPIVCRSAQVDISTKGLARIDGFIKVTADMSEDQMQDLFYEIWGKVGDEALEKWVACEGVKLKITNQSS